VLTISLALILLLILANGVFAMSEIAVVTARKSRLRVSAAQGDRQGVGDPPTSRLWRF